MDVYAPGDTAASPPPDDYLTYLLGQSEDGATFSDQSETTVDGLPATLVTATVEDSLDGSVGCPAEDVAADECYGLQPEVTVRMAVIDAGDSTLLAWLRHSGTEEDGDATGEFAGLCCVDGSQGGGEGGSMKRTRRSRPPVGCPRGSLDSVSRQR